MNKRTQVYHTRKRSQSATQVHNVWSAS